MADGLKKQQEKGYGHMWREYGNDSRNNTGGKPAYPVQILMDKMNAPRIVSGEKPCPNIW